MSISQKPPAVKAEGANGRVKAPTTDPGPRPAAVYADGWLDRIPAELKARRQWVLWRYAWRKGKWTKVPFQVANPSVEAKPNDPSTWGPFIDAVIAYTEWCKPAFIGDRQRNRIDGIGFVFSPEDPYVGVDLDNCLDAGGAVVPWAFPHVLALETYGEISPSGRGVKFIAKGRLPGHGRRLAGVGPDQTGAVEMYDRTRFFTITGNPLDGQPATVEDLPDVIAALHDEFFPPKDKPEAAGKAPARPPLSVSDQDLLTIARGAKNGDRFSSLFDHGTLTGGKTASEADLSLCNLLAFYWPDEASIDRMFRQSALYRAKWDRADYRATTIGKALDGRTEFYTPRPKPRSFSDGPDGPNGDAHQPEPSANGDGSPPDVPAVNGRAKATADDSIKPNESPDDPHRLARVVLGEFRYHGCRTLAYYKDGFYVWDGTAYRPDPLFPGVTIVNAVKTELDRQNVEAIAAWNKQAAMNKLAGALGRGGAPPTVKKVTRVLVGNVAQALAAMVSVNRDVEPPFWIEAGPSDPDPFNLMPARNALVDLGPPEPVQYQHTPRLFSTFALPYDYDPDAPPAKSWLAFLASQWAKDPESVRELQKWFGLILTPKTSYQKALLLIGPTRSGRSTIREAMTRMIGARNVASTSPIAMSDRFGLEPLVGKTLTVMGDARTGDTHDAAILVDRILRITGEDPVEINRKGLPMLHDVRLRTRLVIVSNETPNFRDNSGAIVGRYLPLLMTESFLGREDMGLADRIASEMPSLLAWAIEGRKMLDVDGKFNVPKSAKHLLDDARDLSSPVSVFVADECTLDPAAEIDVETLWQRWKGWAERNGHKAGTAQIFGRNLKPATSYKVGIVRPRDDDGSRYRAYSGITLKDRTGVPF